MMCFLATDLDWNFAAQCHVVSENTKAQSSWNCNLNPFKCSIVCLMVTLSLPVCCTQPSLKRGQGQSFCEFPQNKQSTTHCCIANAEQHQRKCNRHFTVCVGSLKRHVSRERPPRAASLFMSPVQTIRALRGICAAINSLMVSFSKRVGDLLLNLALLLHRDSHNVLRTQSNLRNWAQNRIYWFFFGVFKHANSQIQVFLSCCGLKHTIYVTCGFKLVEPRRNQCVLRDHFFE